MARLGKLTGFLLLALSAFAATAGVTNYVFSTDGKLAATAPRALPDSGRDFTTGAAVANLHGADAATLMKCGWWQVEMPVVELGMLQYAVITGYVFNASSGIATALVEVKDGAPVKKYTQYKIIGLLMRMGKWAQVKQYLVDNDLFDLFMGAQFLSNADENFVNAKKMMSQLLQLDESVIDELLEACVDTD